MAEEQDLDRDLPASQKRLDEARERGQTPRSRELTTAALLLAGAACLAGIGPQVTGQALAFLHRGLNVSRAAAFDPALSLQVAGELVRQGMLPVLPILGVLFLAALLAPLAIGG